MVGPVPDIVTELSRADVVVVPIRFGSGTRVKIIEAFADRIPVVSTTLGAEGLGADDGRHLLLADSAQDVAAACARLLTQTDLRRRLVEAAHELYLDVFESEVVERRIAAIARATFMPSADPRVRSLLVAHGQPWPSLGGDLVAWPRSWRRWLR